jgi:hypothetical protein
VRDHGAQRGHGGQFALRRALGSAPARYGIDDRFELLAAVHNLAAACRAYLGFDIAERFTRATTPCIVGYRRRPAHDGQDIDAALTFVEAGCVARSA